jgi:hypothetical protein
VAAPRSVELHQPVPSSRSSGSLGLCHDSEQ